MTGMKQPIHYVNDSEPESSQCQPKADGADEMPSRLEKMRRDAYLSKRGINTRQPIQMDLLFPGTGKNQRIMPNDFARSALFTARNKSDARRTLVREKLFHYNENISIRYTGIELRAEDDELIWMQILQYGEGVPMGLPFEFSIKDLAIDIGWHKNGKYYDKVRECISRISANEILILNEKAFGVSGRFSLIKDYKSLNDAQGKQAHYRVWIDPNMIVLFAGNTFARHAWDIYRKLSPVARRLADYVVSHQQPFPLPLEKFRRMCDSSDSSLSGWRRTVRGACVEIQDAGIVDLALLGDSDNIHCKRS